MTADHAVGNAVLLNDATDAFERTAVRTAWAFVGLGIALRLLRFASAFPLWGDEAMLAVNLRNRDFAGLTNGLDFCQVAPIGYLWAQKAVIEAFGFNDYSLRTVSLISGICALIVFRIAAGHVLRGWPLIFSVGILSVSYYSIRHSVETKPYAGDLLAAVLLIEPYLAWLARPARAWTLWRLCAVTIVAVPMSFTASFVGGGVSLAIAYEAYRRRDRAAIAPWLTFNLILAGTFSLLYFTVMNNDYAVNGDGMREYWQEGFPPSLARWTEWPLWLLRSHAGESMALPVGGDNGGSAVQFLLAIVGSIALWRSKVRGVVALALFTLLVAFIAASLHRYPYGHGERLQQYWAPTACLLIGFGLTEAGNLLGSELVMRRWRIAVAGLLFCYGMGVGVTKAVFPYKTWEDADHRDFSRRLWRSDSPDEPLLEVSKDLGVHLYSHFGSLNGHLYRDLYGTRPTVSPNAPIAERLGAVPPGKTIRCVAIHRPGERLDSSAYATWLSAMSRQYGLVNEETHELLYDEYHLSYCYRIWRFEAKSPDAHPLTALQPEATPVR